MMIAMDLLFVHADSKDPDQTGCMPRLIGIFAGHNVTSFIFLHCVPFFVHLISYCPIGCVI